MKQFRFFFSFFIFFLLLGGCGSYTIPKAQAGFFTDTEPYKVQIVTTDSSATVTARLVDDSLFGGSNYSFRECEGTYGTQKICSAWKEFKNITHDTQETFSFSNLKQNTDYTLYVQANTNGYYPFKTELLSGASNNTYTLYTKQEDGYTDIQISVPNTDKNQLFLSFKNTSTGNITVDNTFTTVAQKIPGATVTAYVYQTNQATVQLPNGNYEVTLYSGSNAVVGPTSFIVSRKTLTSAPAIAPGVDYQWPLDFSHATSTYPTITGKINTVEHTDFKNFTIAVVANVDASFPSESNKKPDMVAINNDGTYTIIFSNLLTGATYNVQQTIKSPQSDSQTKVAKFNTENGVIIEGSAQEQTDINNRSYRLLSPLPNLAILYDPDLFAEKSASGTLPPGTICDLNDFLNYIFRLLIGICAVILVVRIMFEGYQLMVTDVPFLRVKAKNSLWQAVFGLIVALSAYLILNTINPKLVQNTISLQPVYVDGIPLITIDPLTYAKFTGGKTILAPEEYYKKVQQYTAGNQTLQCLMVAAINNESAWKPNVIGCDECVSDQNGNKSKSRRVFIASGVKLDGTPLPSNASATDGHSYNPNIFNKDTPGFGLDWRFSKGLGLTQETVFPEGYNGSESTYIASAKPGGSLFNNRQHTELIKQDGSNATVLDFITSHLDPDANIQAGIKEMQAYYQKCNGNIEQTFNAYNSGSCTGNAINTNLRMKDFTSCMQGKVELKKT